MPRVKIPALFEMPQKSPVVQPRRRRSPKPSVSNKSYVAITKRKAEVDAQIKESVKAKEVCDGVDPVVEELTTQKLRTLNRQRGRRMVDALKAVPEFSCDKDDISDLSAGLDCYDLYGEIKGRGCTLQYSDSNKLECVVIYEVLKAEVLEEYQKILAKIAKVTKQTWDDSIEIRYTIGYGKRGFGSTIFFEGE